MTRTGIAAIAATVLAAGATAAHADDRLDRLMAMDSDDWMAELSVSDRARLDAHVESVGSVSTHPLMTYYALPVRYEPIWNLPLATFHEELGEDDSEGFGIVAGKMLSKFNTQLISPYHRIEWPPTATLTIDFSKNGINVSLPVEMDLREGNSYYITSPTSFGSELIETIGSLGQYPRMELSRFDGFVFNESTIQDMPPLGVAVIYNVRIGSIRLDTDFQWAGRPSGIPINGGRDFLK